MSEIRTTGGLEMEFYSKNPALWGVSKALKLAPQYRAKIWDILSPEDQKTLREYSTRIKAIKDQIEASKAAGKGKR